MVKEQRYVEIGRVAYIAFGPDRGKLAAIVDVVDQNRALVEGPCTGVGRKVVNFKAIQLTQFRLKFAHSTRSKTVRLAWENENISQKWDETVWAKKIEAKAKRDVLGDFDRFKLMKAKQARNRMIRVEFNKLKSGVEKVKTKTRQDKKEAKNHKLKLRKVKRVDHKAKCDAAKAAKKDKPKKAKK